MKIEYAARVEIGRRETNDDRVLADGQVLDRTARSGRVALPAVFALCDGCGGYDGGGIAAQTVLETLSREAAESLKDESGISRAMDRCLQAVLEKKSEMPSYAKMCTTIAGCVFGENAIAFFHSGDSRIYRFDRWGSAKMTVDHSAVRQMVDMGMITEEEALIHPNRNVITQCIGIECPPPEIYISGASIAPGEKYLLCSDGFWESVSAEQAEEILSRNISLAEMADALVEEALLQGSDDNTSVCICAAGGDAAVTDSKPYVLE